jgi:hypothetical protein
LGGARPKSSVRDKDGHLAIAKFPRKDDEINIIAWEAVALSLANKADCKIFTRFINTPGAKILKSFGVFFLVSFIITDQKIREIENPFIFKDAPNFLYLHSNIVELA